MKEHHLEVTRTARFCTLGPWEEGGTPPREVWLVLHGYRQLADRFLRRFESLDDGTRLIVAPEALNRFYVGRERGRHGQESLVGGTWMTRHDREREIDDYVRYLDRLAERVFDRIPRADVRVTLLGFSQGLHTAARWAVLGEHPPDRLILWGDYLPPDLPDDLAATRLASMEVVRVRGEGDPSRSEELASKEEERLKRWGVVSEIRTHPGGHEIDGELLGRL